MGVTGPGKAHRPGQELPLTRIDAKHHDNDNCMEKGALKVFSSSDISACAILSHESQFLDCEKMLIPPYSSGFYYSSNRDITTITSTGHAMPLFRQPGRFYNICFRLADSIPQQVLQELLLEYHEFRNVHPAERTRGIFAERSIFHKLEYWLAQGIGECLLGRNDIRNCVSEEILSHDEIECQIGAFVIMRNHIHLLLKMFDDYQVDTLLRNIKSVTAQKIVDILGCRKKIWMKGSFTRIVRSPFELRKTVKYILANPRGDQSIPVYLREDNRLFTSSAKHS